jgi:hypothetical protein
MYEKGKKRGWVKLTDQLYRMQIQVMHRYLRVLEASEFFIFCYSRLHVYYRGRIVKSFDCSEVPESLSEFLFLERITKYARGVI